jgi:hypothetical protein
MITDGQWILFLREHLEERLQAARSTAGFLDKAVANLEAIILGLADGGPTGRPCPS